MNDVESKLFSFLLFSIDLYSTANLICLSMKQSIVNPRHLSKLLTGIRSEIKDVDKFL